MTWATMKRIEQKVEIHDGIPKLEDLQKAVGGYVEVREVGPDSLTMWCNEDVPEKFTGTKQRWELENHKASFMMQDSGYGGDWIAGDVAFTGGPDDQGETTGLSDKQIAYLRHVEKNTKMIGIGPTGEFGVHG